MSRHTDLQDELADEFEPSPLPPIGPDGGPDLQPMQPSPEMHPRLCEAGPCVHYHTFQVQMDVQSPIAARVADGGVLAGAAPPQPFHVETHHYCYPDSGIEFKIGSLPVVTCNRWSPMLAGAHVNRERTEA